MKKTPYLTIITLVVSLFCSAQVNAQTVLPVPYYWQDGAGWCWAATGSMMASYYVGNNPATGQIKPWWAAALRNKPKDGNAAGGNLHDSKAILSTWIPSRSVTTKFLSFFLSDGTKQDYIKSLLDRGHPILLLSQDNGIRAHAIVLTGYSDTHIFFNEPSGAVLQFGRGSETWDGFFDTISKSIFQSDGMILSLDASDSETVAPPSLVGTIDFTPAGLRSGIRSGIQSADGEIALEWSGADNRPGYFFTKTFVARFFLGKRRVSDSTSKLGLAFRKDDTLDIAPILWRTASSGGASITATIRDDKDQEVFTGSATAASLNTNNITVTSKFSIPITDFYVAPTQPSDIRKYTLRLESLGDHVEVDFLVSPPFARYAVLVIDSSGSNSRTDPSDRRKLAAKETIRRLVGESEALINGEVSDRASVIDFDHSVTVLAGLGDPDTVVNAVDAVDSSGGTDIAAGIDRATTLLEAAQISGDINELNDTSAIFVFTDGENGDGPNPVKQAIAIAEALGIRVHYGFLSPQAIRTRTSSEPEENSSKAFQKFALRAASSPILNSIEEQVLATGGVYGSIGDADSQLAFVDQVFSHGLTNIDESSSQTLLGQIAFVKKLDPAFQESIYTFEGNANEEVTIRVTSNDFVPQVTLFGFGPTASRPALGEDLNKSNTNSVSLSVTLPEDGVYTLWIRSGDGNSGLYSVFVDVENDLSFGDPEVTVVGAPRLNPQTGLIEVKLQITNSTGGDISGVSVSTVGLPNGVTAYNASESSGNRATFGYPQPIPNGGTVTMILEFFDPNRETFPDLTYTAVASNVVFPETPGINFSINRFVLLEDGDILIEINTVPERKYIIEYSEDMSKWIQVQPPIIAVGTKTQWIDSGPPKTPPRGNSRFYRVLQLAQ